MSFIANTAFEARIVNDRFDDLANIAGKYYVSTTATDCSAGQLCTRDSLLDCEGFSGVKNENTWKMVKATNSTTAGTPIYACDPHDWPLIGNGRNLWAVGTETLGLGIPPDATAPSAASTLTASPSTASVWATLPPL